MSSDLPSTTVPEAQAAQLLLVRAFEESDRSGRLLSSVERERATPRGPARAEHGLEPFVERARELLGILRGRVRGVDGMLAAACADAGALWLVPLALLVGLASNVLGGSGLVNVLAFPLFGALVWNLAVYALLAIAAARPARARAAGTARPGLARRLAVPLLGSRLRRAFSGATGEAAAAAAEARATFAELWSAAARPLLAARLRRALHLGALALVAGMVGGMYLRGIAFEYRAQWSSTFLTPELVDRWLAAVLAPAQALSGIELPAAGSIRAPQSGDAAPWIHLWALTAALLVVLPRAALWTAEGLRIARLRRALPLDLGAPYWRRLRSASAGGGVRVQVLPFGAALAPRSADRLRTLLHDLFGARAEVTSLGAQEYGSEAAVEGLSSDGAKLVIVFPLAQTPELEVHARLLSQLARRVSAGAGLLAVVDAAGFSEQLGGDATAHARLDERRRAWDRVLREAGLGALHVDLSAAADERELERAAAALWTSEREEPGV